MIFEVNCEGAAFAIIGDVWILSCPSSTRWSKAIQLRRWCIATRSKLSGKGNSNIPSFKESLTFEYLEKENIFFGKEKEEEQIFEERKSGQHWLVLGGNGSV